MVQFDNYKRELAFIFFVQMKKILLVTLLITSVAIAVAYLSPPIYTAEGSILVKSKKINRDLEALEETQLRAEAVEAQDLYSEMAILTSSEVMNMALTALRQDYPQMNLVDLLGENPDTYYLALRKLISARVLPDSNVLGIQLQANSPLNAKTLLSAIMEQYIHYRKELYEPKSMNVYFQKQLERYRDDATQKGEEIRSLVEAGGVTQSDRQIAHNLDLRKDLMNSKMIFQAEAVDIRLQINDLQKWLSNSDDVQFFSFIDNDGLLALSERVQILYEKQVDIQSRYKEGSEPYERAQSQFNEANNGLRQEIKRYVEDKITSLKVIEGKLEVLSNQIAEIERSNIALRNNQIRIDQLENDLKIIRASYDVFYQRSQESIAAADSKAVNLNSYVSILSPAQAIPEPIFPKPKLLIPIGVITGIILGLTLGFIFEFFDHSFKRPEEVEEHIGVPVIMSIKSMPNL